MKKFLHIIKKAPLFLGTDEKEIETMLNCLSAKTAVYNKNDFIFRYGDSISTVGMVLSGSVHIINEDFWGNRSILSRIPAGLLFGETYACAQAESIGVSAIAAEQTEVLFLDVLRITSVCSCACVFHTKLIRNLLSVFAERNLTLMRKMDYLVKRTTREKLLSYLSDESLKNGSPVFEIPFNRQQLADYLSVDRSAMSNELSKLRDEGVLNFQKNRFELLEGSDL